jgi:hypothetical protein
MISPKLNFISFAPQIWHTQWRMKCLTRGGGGRGLYQKRKLSPRYRNGEEFTLSCCGMSVVVVVKATKRLLHFRWHKLRQSSGPERERTQRFFQNDNKHSFRTKSNRTSFLHLALALARSLYLLICCNDFRVLRLTVIINYQIRRGRGERL